MDENSFFANQTPVEQPQPLSYGAPEMPIDEQAPMREATTFAEQAPVEEKSTFTEQASVGESTTFEGPLSAEELHPNAYQQPNTYQQPNVYQQPSAYQQPNAYQQSSIYQQPRTDQQPNTYQQPNMHQKPNTDKQSNIYQQQSMSRQPNVYQQQGMNPQPNVNPQPSANPMAGMQPRSNVPPHAQNKPVNAARKEEKKSAKPNFFLRALGAVGLAMIFGIVGGLTLWGALILGNKMNLYSITSNGNVTPPIATQPSEPTPSPEPTSVGENGIKQIEDVPTIATMDVSDVAKAVMPSMVSVHTLIDYDYYGYIQEGEGSGSGFIVGESETELLMATNYHVIADGKKITVQFVDDSTAEAVVKGKNIPMDVAVIAVKLDDLSSDTKATISIAKLGDSDSLVVGEPAVAIGNALGYGQSVTTGVISALNREQTLSDGSTGYFIQTDAAINPGNSGGALLDMEGYVIGINSSKLGGDVIEGMGYAIPISVAQPIIEDLSNKKSLAAVDPEEQSYLGINGADVKSGNSSGIPVGVYVSEVFPDTPAELAGIQKGDIITKFDGDSIADMKDLKKYLESYVAGTEVSVTVMRYQDDGTYKEEELKVSLGHATS